MHVERRICIANGDDALRYVHHAAPPARRHNTRGRRNRGAAGRIVMGLVEPHPEYALARRYDQTSQLLVFIRDHFTAKDFAFCRVDTGR